MRKPDFCICENKEVFVFATWIVQSLFVLNPNSQASTILCGCTARFVSDLVGNPEDRFSQNEAHIIELHVLYHTLECRYHKEDVIYAIVGSAI